MAKVIPLVRSRKTWNPRDLAWLKSQGIEDSDRQQELFAKGVDSLQVLRPCDLGDGILKWDALPHGAMERGFQTVVRQKKLSFFIPASGAATRLFGFLEKDQHSAQAKRFFKEVLKLPLAASLKAHFKAKGFSLETWLKEKEYKKILEVLFQEEGYGRLPKAMLPFHQEGSSFLTALEEHLRESEDFASVRLPIHFTMEPRYSERLQSFMEDKSLDSSLVTFSYQESSTQTLAQGDDGVWLRDESGQLMLRPGGHGALLVNLARLSTPFVYLRNIDNISQAWHRQKYRHYRQGLVGLAAYLWNKNQEILKSLDADLSAKTLDQAWLYMKNFFGVTPLKASALAQAQALRKRLRRPFRVAAMVKSKGQVGGGPFWVKCSEGPCLQILEATELKPGISHGAYFNPVEIVAAIANPQGGAWNLQDFVDEKSWILGKKYHEGRPVRTLERPGLWNGSMAYWNTCFVEIPAASFTPVKTALDLLKVEHQAKVS
ncbi:MAG: DUF4301 family protein [Deltaproteobacteria bacterium]|nr:DUF4301 family protein [Deltaproteobacteria bacterium]